jgi:hypothetical protein
MKKQWLGESKKERADNKKFRIGVLVCHLNFTSLRSLWPSV